MNDIHTSDIRLSALRSTPVPLFAVTKSGPSDLDVGHTRSNEVDVLTVSIGKATTERVDCAAGRGA